MSSQLLKLPKDITVDSQIAFLTSYFSANLIPLRPDHSSGPFVSQLAFDAPLQSALQMAMSAGHLVQGLEQAGKVLDREHKGLAIAQAKSPQPTASRMSRLLLLSNDGSSRFYRDAEDLLHRHQSRLWICLLDASADELGRLYSKKGKPTKALLIDDRATLGACLQKLAAHE